MINNDRIVPITAIDLISMYGVILKNKTPNITKLDADDVNGNFTMNASAQVIASEPVKSFNFVTSGAMVYFVPAYDYTGFQINGVATTTVGDTVNADGRTLYSATLSSGTITIAKVGF